MTDPEPIAGPIYATHAELERLRDRLWEQDLARIVAEHDERLRMERERERTEMGDEGSAVEVTDA